MATYSTNFSEYTSDVAPSDWTARWVTTNSTWSVEEKSVGDGGKTLEHTSTADARRLLSWDDIDADADRDDAEIVMRFRSTSESSEVIRAYLRASGAAAAETGYFVNLPTVSNDIRIHKYVAGVSSGLGTAVSYTDLAVNIWYYIRFRAEGTDLKVKIWKDGEEEPSGWLIEITDASIAAAGWVGVGGFESTGTKDFDYFAVGTNGDTAPINVGADTIVRSSQAVTEIVSNTTAKARASSGVAEIISNVVATARMSVLVIEVLSTSAEADTTNQHFLGFIS